MTHGPDQKDWTGVRAGRLIVTGPAAAAEEFRGRAQWRPWRALCDCGRATTVKRYQLGGKYISCGECGFKFGKPRGDVITYKAWHKRIKADKGRARDLPCHDCGGSARQWSYQNDCPDEQIEEGVAFCTHLEHYVPRCHPCHKTFDHQHRPRLRPVRAVMNQETH